MLGVAHRHGQVFKYEGGIKSKVTQWLYFWHLATRLQIFKVFPVSTISADKRSLFNQGIFDWIFYSKFH